jgi:putative addiction module antidote
LKRTKLNLRVLGSSAGILLPKAMLSELGVKKNDMLTAVRTPEGYLLTRRDPERDRQIKAGRSFMRKYRAAFRALAE